jgi:hypothetical protein
MNRQRVLVVLGFLAGCFVHRVDARKAKRANKSRELPIVEVNSWLAHRHPTARESLANGTNCLAILNVGQLRTFNWPGVWQSQAARLPHSPQVEYVLSFLALLCPCFYLPS